MAWRRKNPVSSRQVFTCLMVFSVGVLLLPRRLTDRVDHVMTLASAPFTSPSRQMSLAVIEKLDRPGESYVESSKYQRLEAEYRRTRARLVNLESHTEQLEQLVARLSGLQQKFGLARVELNVAEVIGTPSTSWRQMVNVDRGSLDHVHEGQVVLGSVNREDVIDPENDPYSMCVVGRVQNAGLRTSEVQLLSDPGFSLPVSVIPRPGSEQEWRAEGVLQGKGLGQIEVGMVSVQGHPIQLGDLVLACSDPKSLPVEMLAAVVSSCRRDDANPLMWRIEAKPAASLDRLSQLVIVESSWGGASREKQ